MINDLLLGSVNNLVHECITSMKEIKALLPKALDWKNRSEITAGSGWDRLPSGGVSASC